ncbi:MAG: DUF1345 domain-containing protein [Verrucomicrobiota bacterium]|nr:DUF1345 domain-containing protein [Verrucomicrobiota bacterium]
MSKHKCALEFPRALLYKTAMAPGEKKIDKPEPRWQALLALVVVGCIYLALPRTLVFGPIWLLPAVVAVLLVPTIFAHRTGRNSVNHWLGIGIGAVTTVALIASVALLVVTLPNKRESPETLLGSAALLWVCNLIVFALWYWRLDGGGPAARQEKNEFGSRSFVFPQMQIEESMQAFFGVKGWRPDFVDYLFVAFTTSTTFGPTDSPLLARWAKLLTILQSLISLAIVVLLVSRAVGVI